MENEELLQEEEAIEASDLELRREGPSYTYETVEQLRVMYPQAELFLLTEIMLQMCLTGHTRKHLDQKIIQSFGLQLN